MKKFASRGYRGRDLETVVIASQREVIRVDKMNAGARFLRGGKSIQTRGPVDFIGEVVATGRALHFDAKQTDNARGFYLSLLKPHQLAHLERHADAKAIAGVLVECTADNVAAFFWIDVKPLSHASRNSVPCLLWNGEGVTPLGGNKFVIKFEHVPAIAGELRKAS